MSMTLEQVRDWHISKVARYHEEAYPRAAQRHQKMADAIDAHLIQPAQSVAIYPVGHFIETSAGEYGRVSREHECDSDVFQLYRSTGNAQSVDVRDVVLKSLGGYLERHWPDNPVSYDDMANKLTAALQEKGNG